MARAVDKLSTNLSAGLSVRPYVQTRARRSVDNCGGQLLTVNFPPSWAGERRRKLLLRRSPFVPVLMPQDSFRCLLLPGCACRLRRAAMGRGLLSLRDLLSARAVLAVVVSGALLPRPPCGSWLVLPCSAVRAAVAAFPAVVSYRPSPLPIPAWSRSGQSWDITSPSDSQGGNHLHSADHKCRGLVSIGTPGRARQYHDVIKSLRFALGRICRTAHFPGYPGECAATAPRRAAEAGTR